MEKIVNQRFIEVKELLNINNNRLAEKLGVSHTAINNIIAGGGVSVKMAKKLKDVFGVNPDWLLYGRGDIFLEKIPDEVDKGENIVNQLRIVKGMLIGKGLWQEFEPYYPKCKVYLNISGVSS